MFGSCTKIFTAAALVLSVALTGCKTMEANASFSPSTSNTPETAPVAASNDKPMLICIVKHANPALQNEELLKAISAGVESVGAKSRIVERSDMPKECRFNLLYGVSVENKKVNGIQFQAALDGKLFPQGNGKFESEKIPFRTVAAYAANYLRMLASKQEDQNSSVKPENQKDAETSASASSKNKL